MNDLQFMPHQEEVLHLTDDKNRCAYYLDMGLGKTFVFAEQYCKFDCMPKIKN